MSELLHDFFHSLLIVLDSIRSLASSPRPYLLNPVDFLLDLLQRVLTHPYIYGFLGLWDIYLGQVPYNRYLLAALLLLIPALAVFLIWFTRRPKDITPSRLQSGKDLLRGAKRAARQGEFVRAGELYEMSERYESAIKMYLQGKSPGRAAQVYLNRLKDPERAVALYLKYNLYEGAAKAYAQAGNYREAGENYLKANKSQAAAEMLEKGGDFLQGGDLYFKNGMFREAARSFGKTPNHHRAAESYEAFYKEIRSGYHDRIPPEKAQSLADLAKKAAYFYKSAGEIPSAVSILLQAGLKPYAAELLVEQGQLDKAVELFVEVGQHLRAAEACATAGRTRQASEIRAQYHMKQGQTREALRYYEEAGDYLSAADLYAGQGDLLKAGELFLKGGDSKTAAETFFAAGHPEKAAEAYEATGDFARAIQAYEQAGNETKLTELYEKAKNYYEAGVLYQKRGLLEKALVCFQKVGRDDHQFVEATRRLGDVYLETGKYPQALERYQQLVAQKPLIPDNLDLYYNLGILYERLNQPQYAQTIYGRILGIHPHFKDVAMRETTLRQRISGASAPATGSSPSLSPHDYTMVGGGPATPVGRSAGGQRYQVLREIGRGGMGVVFLAKDLNLGREVAYKVLPPELKSNPQFVANFVREAKSLAQLSHPYIVAIFDAGVEAGNYYIVMEYVEGQNLKDLLSRSRRIPITSGIQIFSQLCQALDYAHGKKVVHRDIKTGNLMWTPSQIIKVMDFGLAKVIEEAQAGRTAVSGTPYYMSPEQTLGKPVDHRTDIYSLGVTIYEALSGQVPFKEGDIGYQQVHSPPKPPRELNSEIPDALNKIILKCLAKDPSQRYQSARDIYLELKALERQTG